MQCMVAEAGRQCRQELFWWERNLVVLKRFGRIWRSVFLRKLLLFVGNKGYYKIKETWWGCCSLSKGEASYGRGLGSTRKDADVGKQEGKNCLDRGERLETWDVTKARHGNQEVHYNQAKRAILNFKAKNDERKKFCENLEREDEKGNVFRVTKQLSAVHYYYYYYYYYWP